MTSASEDPRDGVLYAGLAELNRHVQQLKEDLVRAGLGEADAEATGAAFPAPRESAAAPAASGADAQGSRAGDEPASALGPGFGQAGDAPAAYARIGSGAEQRAHDIVAAAQREADEIASGIRQQVAIARKQVASANEEAARSRQQARELLVLGEQLVVSVRRALGVFEDHGSRAETGFQERRADTGLAWDAEQAGGRRAGVYAPPAPAQAEPPAPAATGRVESRPATSVQTYIQLGPVTLTAGPLAGVASAFVLEQALERIATVDRARVKRYVDDRVVIELNVTEAVALADELKRVLPFPFEVQAASASGLDIAIGSRSEPSAAAGHGAIDEPGATVR